MKISYNKNFLCLIIFLFLTLIVSVYFFTKDTNEVSIDNNDFYINNSVEKVETTQIIIHITGEINSPGIVYLDSTSRIIDAIDKAGGVTSEANLDKVNLAYELKDGQKIYIPSIYDNDTSNYISNSAGENIIDDSLERENGVVNINTATQSELESLPGIGKSTASKIIDYRNKNGKFKIIDDIMKVSRNRRK